MRTFEAKSSNTWVALSRVRMSTKWVVDQFVLEYLNKHSLHAGYINNVIHKSSIANKLKHAETRSSAYNTRSQ